jgi:hypothetical protein
VLSVVACYHLKEIFQTKSSHFFTSIHILPSRNLDGYTTLHCPDSL